VNVSPTVKMIVMRLPDRHCGDDHVRQNAWKKIGGDYVRIEAATRNCKKRN
jgi:hypothetical protein